MGTYENGEWTGVMKLLVENEIDMCGLSMRVTEERNEVIYFSYPTRSFQSIYIMQRPSVLCPRTFIFNPFTDLTWFLILITIIISFSISFILHFINGLLIRQNSRFSCQFWYAFEKGLSFPNTSLKDMPSLMIHNIFLLFIFFIMMQIYQSRMYAYLASPNKYSIPFYSQKGAMDYVDKGYGYYTAFAKQQLHCSTDENCKRFQQVIRKKPIIRRTNQIDIEEDLDRGGIYESTIDYAFLTSRVTWLNNKKQDRIIIQEDDGSRYLVAYSFSRNNKKLRDKFNKALMTVLPAIPHITSGHGYNTKRQPFHLNLQPTLVALSLSGHLLQLFKLFVYSLSLCVMFFVSEFAIFYIKQKCMHTSEK